MFVAEVSRIAGSTTVGSQDGIGTAATFTTPADCSVSSDGKVYIADSTDVKIRILIPTSAVSYYSQSVVMSGATVDGIDAMVVDSMGTIFIADISNRIKRISTSGK